MTLDNLNQLGLDLDRTLVPSLPGPDVEGGQPLAVLAHATLVIQWGEGGGHVGLLGEVVEGVGPMS